MKIILRARVRVGDVEVDISVGGGRLAMGSNGEGGADCSRVEAEVLMEGSGQTFRTEGSGSRKKRTNVRDVVVEDGLNRYHVLKQGPILVAGDVHHGGRGIGGAHGG